MTHTSWWTRSLVAIALTVPLFGIQQCTGTDADGDDWTVEEGDCNDADASVYPGQVEDAENGKDDDCDGVIDEAILQLDGGEFHSLALTNQGTVMAWGANFHGQLGTGDTTDRDQPAAVALPTDQTFSRLAAGGNHSMAISSEGVLYTWGDGTNGQLCTGYIGGTAQSKPVPVTSLSGVTAAAGGAFHTLVLTQDGQVYACGYNSYGQLGNGTVNSSASPVKVSGLSGVIAVAAGAYHSMALTSAGKVYAWGWNTYGQVGDGTFVDRTTPVQVSSLPTMSSLVAGGYHNMATTADGRVYGWGLNLSGEFCNGTAATVESTPKQIVPLSNITPLVLGTFFTLGRLSDGQVIGCGANETGQLGNGTTLDTVTPTAIPDLFAVFLGSGEQHGMAVEASGKVVAWGNNDYGQLGDNSTRDSSLPVTVSNLP